MHCRNLALWPLAAQAVNIISSNDDGWAEVNIRALFESLGDSGHSVVVSAPAENQSGTGKLCDIPRELLMTCFLVGDRFYSKDAHCLDQTL